MGPTVNNIFPIFVVVSPIVVLLQSNTSAPPADSHTWPYTVKPVFLLLYL